MRLKLTLARIIYNNQASTMLLLLLVLLHLFFFLFLFIKLNLGALFP